MAVVSRVRLLSIPILLFACCCVASVSARAEDQCYTCHQGQGDKPSTLFRRDIHHAKGVTCAGCHGGNAASEDMEKAMDKGAGFIGIPKGDSVSQMCKKCHAGEFEKLGGSIHATLSTTGKESIVQCTTCHNAHGIVAVKDPASPVYPLNLPATCARCHSNPSYMRTYNPSLPVDQMEKYRTSVHGTLNANGDPKPADCASCHGSHDILSVKDVKSRVYPVNLPAVCSECHSNAEYMKQYGIPTDQFEKYSKSVHGVALLEKHDVGAPACNSCHGNHGATPPGVESISNVCGTCHALNAELFSSSPHKKAFDEMGLPECETCHSNHDIVPATSAMLGTSDDAVCVRCHSESDNPAGYRVAMVMRQLTDSLQNAEAWARQLVDDAEQKGMEISEAKFKLRDVRQAELEARTTVHAFDEEKFRGVADKGLITAAVVTADAQEAVHEYYFRRTGLGVATLIITILAGALYLFIRRLERRTGSSG